MNQTKKRNIIIGALCGVLLLMVVGYAAFSSVLNITGTSKISSNWDIKITDIQTKNVVGGATNAEDPTGVGTLNATFKTNLVSPGDSIEYHITIKNGGTLNAKLDKITLSEPNNDMITFTASGLTEGEGLDAGVSKVLTVKVEYKDIPEGQEQPSSTTGTLTVKLDFSQGDGSTVVPEDNIVYRWGTNSLKKGDSIEGIDTTTDYNTLNKSIFLKHIIDNNVIEQSELCFIKDNNLHCFAGGPEGVSSYESNKKILLEVFDHENNLSCIPLHDTYTGCYERPISITIHTDGLMGTSYNSENCLILQDGSSFCE